MADARLAVSATHADGRVTRWGADEPDPNDVPSSITFSTAMPGGFKDSGFSLPRRIDRDYPDLNLYDSIKIYAPGGQSAWEGRIAQLPLQHDDSFAVNVGSVGWSAHLTDDPSFQMIYVDRDLSKWGPPSTTRTVNLVTVGYSADGPDIQPDTANGVPCVRLQISRIVTDPSGRGSRVEAWYDAGAGNEIFSMYADIATFDKGSGGPLAAGWEVYTKLAADDQDGTFDTSSNIYTGASGYLNATGFRRYAEIQMYWTGLSTQLDGEWDVFGRHMTIYGPHGLTGRGSDPVGYYASDVIADIISRAAPLLRYTTGDSGSITPTSFIIPHLSFDQPGTAENAVSLVNGYHNYEWGVWEDRTFFWQPPDPERLTWQARLSDGAKVSLEGDQASDLYNGVVVRYQDPAGITHTIGPPGSGQEAEDANLADTSADNPINAHGIGRRWGVLEISQTCTQGAALQLGTVWLAEHSLPQRRGSLTLTGFAQHPSKGRRPVHEIRAGDWITIADRPGDPARRIIETSYQHDSRTISCSLGTGEFKLDAILERLGVGLVGVL